jgi:hypothetical protein
MLGTHSLPNQAESDHFKCSRLANAQGVVVEHRRMEILMAAAPAPRPRRVPPKIMPCQMLPRCGMIGADVKQARHHGAVTYRQVGTHQCATKLHRLRAVRARLPGGLSRVQPG